MPSAVRTGLRRPERPAINPLRLLLFGRPIPTEHQEHTKLPKIVALPVFASDAISSVAYATQQIILVLAAAGLWTSEHKELYSRLTLNVTAAIILLLAIVVVSYWQVIFAFPGGGGSYIVTRTSLGINFGLVAGAALLIDYVLTVAVSIAAGVQNLLATPLLNRFSDHTVEVCLLFIVGLTLANLRGLKESGTVFAIPTYLFVTMASTMILLGAFGPFIGWEIHADAVNREMPEFARRPPLDLAGYGIVLLVLKAFANGCAAMTGTEAISDTVPAFREPVSRNAGITLIWMAAILAFLFMGISYLSANLHIVYWEVGHSRAMPVIDQLSAAVFGKTGSPFRVGLYYVMQFSTTIILVLAANTSFAGFPTLASIMSRDRLLPRQLANRGDKLVYSNGIVLLGLAAALLVVAFRGSVEGLIPLYAVGVFTAFTLSQGGMCKRWLTQRGPRWRVKFAINFVGTCATAIVLTIIAVEKGPEGAWIVLFVGAALVWLFRGINRHYERCRRDLSIINFKPDTSDITNTVLLLVPTLHRGIFPALQYARSLSPDCRAIHVEDNPDDTPRLVREWDEYVGDEIPLVILPSPYRSLIGPLLTYLNEVRRERDDHIVTVIVPEFDPGKWYHAALHNANGFLVKHYLGHLPGVIVSNFRYHPNRMRTENGSANNGN
ncbi:MAG: APC family permease [Chthonomonadales bacterium]|nr:APC family permease [Chthonomonadales bacterium]